MKIYIFAIILVLATAITTYVITRNIDQPQKPTQTEIQGNLDFSDIVGSPKPQHNIIYKPVPTQQPVQDSTLKIEQCKVQAQIAAKQAAKKLLQELIAEANIPELCRDSYDSGCELKWLKTYEEIATNQEKNQYYPTLYSRCLNQ